jgi:hypothetical protein
MESMLLPATVHDFSHDGWFYSITKLVWCHDATLIVYF